MYQPPAVLLFLDFLNPEYLIQYGGFALLLFIVFAETGLFFGFFLPGDSLLFVAGFLSGSQYLDVSVSTLIPALIIAAVAGSAVGYFSGRWAGRYFETKKDNIIFKRKYLDMTRSFYQRYGAMALILGRFLPIIRTFVTILAGTARIPFGKFFVFNFLGAAAWVATMVLAGHWMGNIFPNLTDYLDLIVVGMIVVTTIPLVRAWRKA